jgi:hypothetical protein
MRLACRRCERRGRYRVDGFLEEHGPDIALPDLRPKLAVGCALVGHRSTSCGVYYVDLLPTNG